MITYIIHLFKFMSSLPLQFHIYTNDIQLYLRCTDDITESPTIIASAITSIHRHLSANLLAYNPLKIETIHFLLPSRNRPTSTTPPPIIIDNQPITYFNHVKNLGIIMDTSALTSTSPMSPDQYTTISTPYVDFGDPSISKQLHSSPLHTYFLSSHFTSSLTSFHFKTTDTTKFNN